jgi:hypothetical protein
MGEEWHLIVTHVIFFFVTFHHTLNQLKVSRRCLLNPAIKVKSITSSSLIVSGLHIFEFVGDGVGVVSHKVMETNSETSRLFRKKVRIILNCCHFLSYWKKLLWQLLCDDLFKSFGVEIKTCSQKVWFEEADIILTVYGEISIFGRDDKF